MPKRKWIRYTIYKKNDYLLHGHKISENENFIPFPFPVINNDFCGQVIHYKDNNPYKVFEYII